MLRKTICVILVIIFMSFGVSFSIKSGLGTSPISSCPYVLSLISPLTVGNATTLINCILIALQPIILRKDFRPGSLVQVPVAFLFGYMTDIALFAIRGLSCDSYLGQWIFCLVGIVLIGIAVAIEGFSGCVVLSGEGLALAISQKTGRVYGNVKVAVDCTLVFLAVLISVFSLHKIAGVREGTVAAAVLVGVLAKFYMRFLEKKGEKIDEPAIDG